MPVMWYLWLYPGSGNANFYYNQTLVFQFGIVRIFAKFVVASMKRNKLIRKSKNVVKTTIPASL